MKLTPIAEMSKAEREACIQAFLRDDAERRRTIQRRETLGKKRKKTIFRIDNANENMI